LGLRGSEEVVHIVTVQAKFGIVIAFFTDEEW